MVGGREIFIFLNAGQHALCVTWQINELKNSVILINNQGFIEICEGLGIG